MIIDRGEDPGPFSQPRDYVTHLRGRFRRRCAYCLTPDDRLGGEEGMKVDHFLPESRHADLRLAWSNLYYCCDVCNNRKSNFPTPDESIFFGWSRIPPRTISVELPGFQSQPSMKSRDCNSTDAVSCEITGENSVPMSDLGAPVDSTCLT
jgi:hypothetical protein